MVAAAPELVRFGAADALVGLLRACRAAGLPAATATAAAAAVQQLAAEAGACEQLQEAGACAALVGVLQLDDGAAVPAPLVAAACNAIAAMASGMRNPGALTSEGADGAALRALSAHPASGEVVLAASQVLAVICQDSVAPDVAVRAVPALLAALAAQPDNADVAHAVVRALCAIVPRSTARTTDGEILRALAPVMRTHGPRSAPLAADVCTLLSYMVSTGAAAEVMVANGAGALLVAALRAHNTTFAVPHAACRALYSLTYAGTPAACAVPLYREGVADGMMALLRDNPSNPFVLQYTTSVLAFLTSNPANVAPMFGNGVGALVTTLLQRHGGDRDPAVFVSACDLIQHLAVQTDTCEPLWQGGAGSAILDAMRRQPDSVPVARAACAVLLALSAADSLKPVMVDAGVVEQVASTMRTHGMCDVVGCRGSGTLSNLAATSALRQEVVNAGGGAAVVAVLRLNGRALPVVTGCLTALNQLSMEPRNRPWLRVAGARPVLAELARSPAADRQVRGLCADILRALDWPLPTLLRGLIPVPLRYRLHRHLDSRDSSDYSR